MDASISTSHEAESLERETIRKVSWRLLPLLMLGYFCAYLDRANVGMAGLTMTRDMGFSNAVFGFGAGLFFLGYSLAEIPSNLVLNKVGARRWLARIMISWGLVAGLTAFVWNDWSFYAIRILLGLSEAGFYPGVMLYLTWWFPARYRSRMIAIFCSAVMISMFIGPPVGGLLLGLDGVLGLHGWQWLFVVEALPSVLMGLVTWKLLTDRPTEATWLKPEQRAWLNDRLAAERAKQETARKLTLAGAFRNPTVWLLAASAFGQTVGSWGVGFFLPLIVKGLGVTTGLIGLISGLPYIFALLAMNYWGWHSDRTGERPWHAAGAWLLAASGLVACAVIGVGHPVLVMIALTLVIMGQFANQPAVWAMPSALLTGTAAAGGMALINTVGQMGGWFGPTLFGLVKDATGNDTTALLALASGPLLAAVAVLIAGRQMKCLPTGA